MSIKLNGNSVKGLLFGPPCR